MKNNRLQFIPPTTPLPQTTAKYFIDNFKDKITDNVANYEGIIAFLPTKGACKTLKNNIITQLFEQGVENVIGLHITTYEDYLNTFDKDRISKLENYSIWLSILLNIDFNLISNLLPDAKNISRKEVLYIAKEIIFLQKKLNDDLISIGDACQKFTETPDSKRWKDLSLLEDYYNQEISNLGKVSTLQNTLKSIDDACNCKFKTLLIVGNPDITPSLKHFARKAEQNNKNVQILVFSEKSNIDLFDDFGAPKAFEYSNKELSVNQKDIFVCSTPRDEAVLVQNLAKSYKDIDINALGIACEQKETALIFQDSLNDIDVKAIALEQNKLSKTAIFDFLKNIKEYLDDNSFENFTNLCLNSLVIDYIQNIDSNISQILSILDKIKDNTACKDSQTLKNLTDNKIIIDLINIFESLNIDNLEETILKFTENLENSTEIAALELFKTSINDIFAINNSHYLSFNVDEIFTILFETLEGANAQNENQNNSILLQDWMEIFWSQAPHILLCDMNDGIVPLRENNGLFLNDSIRNTLSMRTQKIRQARDAYMLETLAKSRSSSTYAISILLSQRNLKGEPLVPSRILFQTKTDDIAQRVKFLFKEIPPETSDISNELDWKLNVENKAYEGNFSVSKFNTFLNSPWLFYLQNVLKMNVINSQKDELDNANFGTIYHSILEKFGNSEIKNSENPKEIYSFFIKTLDNIIYKNFAKSPRTQIKIQFEDLKSRLYYTAQQQALHRKNGWEIIYVEKKFENYQLSDNVLLNGIFDRIDYHKTHGYLIIDYKTKSKADKNIIQDSHFEQKKNEPINWKNLQMPLYLEVFEHLNLKTDINASVNCAYFCATKDGDSTKIYHWENAQDYVDDAKNVALDIAEKIKNKEFFDFEKQDKYNNFGSVFKLDFDLLKNNIQLR